MEHLTDELHVPSADSVHRRYRTPYSVQVIPSASAFCWHLGAVAPCIVRTRRFAKWRSEARDQSGINDGCFPSSLQTRLIHHSLLLTPYSVSVLAFAWVRSTAILLLFPHTDGEDLPTNYKLVFNPFAFAFLHSASGP
jgi:hypothetical protein